MIIAAVFAPLALPLLLVSPAQAAVAVVGIGLATGSATAIQLWFRVEARRAQFRRRQTASRFATFAEAFSSIGWAATAGLALAMPVMAALSAAVTVAVLVAARKAGPRGG
jgi:ABC-2 type transport system permease protein